MSETLSSLVARRYGPGTPGGEGLPAEPPLATILARRTHRRYADRPVEDGLLDLLLACAFSASAKSDLQQASVLRVADPALRSEIAALVPAMPWIGAAPVLLVWCGDGRRIRRICAMRGTEFANDHLDAMFNPTVDAALAMQTFILAAEAAGLGCCPISVLRNHAARVSGLLGLPRWVFPVAGLCVGWPAGGGHVSMRLPPAVTVHVDRYDDDKLEAGVAAYDRRRDAAHRIPEQRDPARFGEAAFYGWSEDKARQTAVRERGDFGAFLRGQGFRLE